MRHGDVVVRREVWRGQPWSALAVVVIEDSPDLLAVHVPVGAPLECAADHPLGMHPWTRADRWQGLDVVMLHRPDEAHSVWFFGRSLTYINLQDPFRRTSIGFDTFDHELDIVVPADSTWAYKDEDHLAASIGNGRFAAAEVAVIEEEGRRIGASIDDGSGWWLERATEWANWSPPSGWPTPALRPDWANSAH